MNINIEEKMLLARVAEKAERFGDMVEFLEEILEVQGGYVNRDERSLISLAFKNLIRGKR